MKMKDVVVGKVYAVRVGTTHVLKPVRVDRIECARDFGFGSYRRQPRFFGVNLATGREISGGLARLRREWSSRVEPV